MKDSLKIQILFLYIMIGSSIYISFLNHESNYSSDLKLNYLNNNLNQRFLDLIHYQDKIKIELIYQNNRIVEIQNKIHNLSITQEISSYNSFHPRKYRVCNDPQVRKIGEGSSMEPLFFVGDYYYIDEVNISEVELGDLITYKIPDSYKTAIHSVIGIYKDKNNNIFIITKGLNQLWEKDNYQLYEKDIIGRFCEVQI